MSHPKVTRRKRRTETLKNKMKEYSDIFNVNIAIIIQDRATMQKQTFTFSHDPGWFITPSSSSQSSEIVTWPENKLSNAERLKQRFEQLNFECPP
ncbi:hypothetical protein FPOAC1_007248 [Fusarium poae]|uniref:MADS-box domain-containing protein n=1 Tax=Fusarium poae TaxID=36050 RepID=A0A1B8AJV1_FUSPO|nr:hypothetical protein FPOAC1_007248 [Fusarium poae]KAG8673929.1 hypothetical protein FPOAC1_007248 [Fusarium poae]OBS20554.1 hypothetical protein FPOA_06912 [Fusarium poae]